MIAVCGSGVSMLLMYLDRSPRRGEAKSLYAGSYASAYVNFTSSEVIGWPSDHFRTDRS